MYVPIMYAKIILVFIVNSYWFLVSKSEPPFFYYFFQFAVISQSLWLLYI
jgi:hypothetical protein